MYLKTTEGAEKRMRTLRGINILEKNKKLRELIVSKTLCSLWLIALFVLRRGIWKQIST